jgi:hypothetical protein
MQYDVPNTDSSLVPTFLISRLISQHEKVAIGVFIKSILISDDSWFNQRMVLNLISAQKCGFVNAQRLFSLVMFELWRKTYGISIN